MYRVHPFSIIWSKQSFIVLLEILFSVFVFSTSAFCIFWVSLLLPLSFNGLVLWLFFLFPFQWRIHHLNIMTTSKVTRGSSSKVTTWLCLLKSALSCLFGGILYFRIMRWVSSAHLIFSNLKCIYRVSGLRLHLLTMSGGIGWGDVLCCVVGMVGVISWIGWGDGVGVDWMRWCLAVVLVRVMFGMAGGDLCSRWGGTGGGNGILLYIFGALKAAD